MITKKEIDRIFQEYFGGDEIILYDEDYNNIRHIINHMKPEKNEIKNLIKYYLNRFND